MKQKSIFGRTFWFLFLMVFANFNLKIFKEHAFFQVYSVGIGLNRIRFNRNRRRAQRELLEIAEIEGNVFTVDEFEELSDSLVDITRILCPPRVCPAV